MTYPRWRYFPSHARHPQWVDAVVAAFAGAQEEIDSDHQTKSSNAVLASVASALQAGGFTVEGPSGKLGRIVRPVLFGEGGSARTTYSVDAVHATEGVLVEVEAGRGWMSNAVYRDLVRTSLVVDARFLVLAVRRTYSYMSAGKRLINEDYRLTDDLLDAIYVSGHLKLPFEGVLLIGY